MPGDSVLVVVPARGGSKGLPRKNARTLVDLPLLGWTARAIQAAGLDGRCCLLSTDDAEIAEIGRSVGLPAPFLRPASLATDEATAESVALHALDWLAASHGIHPHSVMWLQPTSPFRNPQSLEQAVSMLTAGTCPGVIGVKPVYRSLKTLYNSDDLLTLTPVDDNAVSPNRRQAAQPLFTPNGALYLVRASTLRESGTFFPKGSRGIVMDQIASIDIDDSVDWAIAEAVAAAGLTWRGKIAGPKP